MQGETNPTNCEAHYLQRRNSKVVAENPANLEPTHFVVAGEAGDSVVLPECFCLYLYSGEGNCQYLGGLVSAAVAGAKERAVSVESVALHAVEEAEDRLLAKCEVRENELLMLSQLGQLLEQLEPPPSKQVSD